ncbi:hypothetical protein BC938DRAFT_481623 [Jimgerdemannia flammicorona]|uniref:Prolyl 4-hydroxylase alpha subunit domain-containing protein n=1 Tax=Jimgerdemannia flammicorona TaxID=994334 RepID=A0A433QWR2_9FUNG|nr:hypothetical protein BC938DRAFT_481623 [Jimgerdemannia flammicorona]
MTTNSNPTEFPSIDLSSFLLPVSDPTRLPITVEPLTLPASVLSSTSTIEPKAYVLHNILTPAECAGFIQLADTGILPSGEPLLVPTNDGRTQRYVNSDRGIINSLSLANVVWERIRDVLGKYDEQISGVLEVKDEDDGPHRDGVLVTDLNRRSMKTFMFYLNGDFEGGTTNFVDDQDLYTDEVTGKIRARVLIYFHIVRFAKSANPFSGNFLLLTTIHPLYIQDGTIASRVRPEAGMALVFNHGLLHEGDVLLSGKKYILRSEIMFSRIEPIENSAKESEAIQLKQRAEQLESEGRQTEAVALYRRAFKLCPDIENF